MSINGIFFETVNHKEDVMPVIEKYASVPEKGYQRHAIIYDDIAPFENYHEAEKFLKQKKACVKMNKEDFAVPYYDIAEVENTSKEFKQVCEKIHKLCEETNDYIVMHTIRSLKAARITCRKCNSVLAKEYLIKSENNENQCPLCGNDLRPKYVLKKLKKFNNKEEMLRTEKAKIRKELTKIAPVKWLILMKGY